MTIHIASNSLVVAELSDYDERCTDGIRDAVNTVLNANGLERWNSMELSVFDGGKAALVFASPVRVLLPDYLLRLGEMAGCDLT